MNADSHDDMQLEALKIFCDVVRWASFSRGALENRISQSSASQAVHQLELRLGVKLIDRSKRPLVLTPQGKVYYEGCKDLVGRYLEVENRVKALEDEHNVVGTVRVASIYSVGLNHMSRYVRTFGELYPGAEVRLEYLHPTRVVESVCGEGAELGLISYPAQVARPDGDPLARGGDDPGRPPVAPVRRAGGRRGRAAATARSSWPSTPTCRSAAPSTGSCAITTCRCESALEFDNIENIKRAVEIPSGVAILPEPTVAREVAAGTLVAVRIDPRTGPPPDAAPGDHPPAEPPAGADRVAVPRAADVRGHGAERRRRRGRAMIAVGRRGGPTAAPGRPS